MMKRFQIGLRSRGFVLALVLMATSLSTGCAALQERAGDFLKDQGYKILSKQIEKIKLDFDTQLEKEGIKVEKLDRTAQELAMILKGGFQGDDAISKLKQAVTTATAANASVRNEMGDLSWKGILAMIAMVLAYLGKQGLWGSMDRKRDEKLKEVNDNKLKDLESSLEKKLLLLMAPPPNGGNGNGGNGNGSNGG